MEKTPYVLLYIKRIILTSLKFGEVAVRLPTSVGLLGWVWVAGMAIGLPTINGLLRFLFVAHAWFVNTPVLTRLRLSGALSEDER